VRDGKAPTISEPGRAHEDVDRGPQPAGELPTDERAELLKARRAAEAERKRFYDVLETLPAYLILLTPDYRITYMNRFFRERFGDSGGRRCFEYLFDLEAPCESCRTYDALKNMAPLEWEWLGPDGRVYYIYDFPFTDVDGSTVIMEVGLDVTDRKRVEDELRQHKENLERLVMERTNELERKTGELDAILASIADPVIVYDKNQVPVRLNSAARELLRLDAGWAQGSGPKDESQGPDEGSGRLLEWTVTSRALKGETVRSMEYALAGPDGRTRTFLGSSAPILDSGRVAGAVSSLHDITDLKETGRAMHELLIELTTVTAEALRRADELDSILASIAEPVVVYDADGDPLRANAAFRDFFGFDPLGLSGSQLSERLDPHKGRSGTGTAEEVVRAALRGETVKDREQEVTDPVGNVYTQLVSCSPVLTGGKPTGAVTSWHDITGIKRLEQVTEAQRRGLEERNSQLQALFDYSTASLALFTATPPYTVLAHNRYYQELWREPFRTEGLVGRSIHEYVPGVEVQGVKAIFDEVARTGRAKNLLNFPYEGLDRGKTWWNWHLAPVMRGTEVIALAHMAMDITSEVLARERAEESARMMGEANSRLAFQAELLANVHDAIFATDAETKITFWNRAAEEIYGWRASEVLGRVSGEILRSDINGQTRQEVLDALMRTGRWSGEVVQRRKDGRPITIDASSIVLKDVDGKVTGLATVNREITGQRKA